MYLYNPRHTKVEIQRDTMRFINQRCGGIIIVRLFFEQVSYTYTFIALNCCRIFTTNLDDQSQEDPTGFLPILSFLLY